MRRTLLLVAAGIGLLASLGILALRWSVEAHARAVEVILDGSDWEALAAREGRDPAAFLVEARARGATSIGLYERTLTRMAERGEVAYLSTDEILTEARLRPLAPVFRDLLITGEQRAQALYVAAAPEMLGLLDSSFRGLLGPSRVRRVGPLLEIMGRRADLEEMGVGFLPDDLGRYRRLGFQPVLRLRNSAALTAPGLRHYVEGLARLGRGYTVVFELTEVLGFEGLIDETAAALRRARFRYGRIEVFSAKRKQRGEDQLAARMRPEVIRLFSLTPEELLTLSPAAVRDKFVRAARERNIRLLYVRPVVTSAGVVASEANLAFLKTLTSELRRFGLQPGPAAPLPEVRVHRGLLLGVSVGAFAVMGMALLALGEAVGVRVSIAWVWALVLAGGLLTAGMPAGPRALLLKLVALGTASVVPALAVIRVLPKAATGRPILQSLRALWLASAGSVAGGLLVAALLTDWSFMMAADIFLGVKLAHLIPVALVLLLGWSRDRPVRDWRDATAEIWAWSSRPVLWRYAIVVIVAGLAAVVLLGRSGNFGLPVLAAEERLRTFMEDVLIARPRTKEYLVGHPALALAAALAAAGWRRWAVLLAAAGTIGQAGVVNSFSHIHTPLLYTAWRTVNALLLGSVLGATAVAITMAALRRATPPRLGPP